MDLRIRQKQKTKTKIPGQYFFLSLNKIVSYFIFYIIKSIKQQLCTTKY